MHTPLTTIPPIGLIWPGQGGIYTGVRRGRDGQPDAHLILAELKPPKKLNWNNGLTWAARLEVEGHADFEVPDEYEGALLFANIREQFERDWHWLRTQYSEDGAFIQGFGGGYQRTDSKKFEARVRAVRSFPVSPSILYVATGADVEASA